MRKYQKQYFKEAQQKDREKNRAQEGTMSLGQVAGRVPTVLQVESSAQGHWSAWTVTMLTLFSALTVSFRETCTWLSRAKVPQCQLAPSFSVCCSPFKPNLSSVRMCVCECFKASQLPLVMYSRYLAAGACHHCTESDLEHCGWHGVKLLLSSHLTEVKYTK